MHSSFSGSVEGRGVKEASKGNEFFYSEFGILKIILNFAPRFERKSVPDRDGAIAQLVEQRTENPCVPGSIPGGTTRKRVVCRQLFFTPPPFQTLKENYRIAIRQFSFHIYKYKDLFNLCKGRRDTIQYWPLLHLQYSARPHP